MPGVVVAALALCGTRITDAHKVRVSGKAHQLKTTRNKEEGWAQEQKAMLSKDSHVQQEQLQSTHKNENHEGPTTGASKSVRLEELTHPAEAQEQRAQALERSSVKVSRLYLVFS